MSPGPGDARGGQVLERLLFADRHAPLLRSPPAKASLRAVLEGSARAPPLDALPVSLHATLPFAKPLVAGADTLCPNREFAAAPAVDFIRTSDPQVPSQSEGLYATVHVPLLSAARRTNARPGAAGGSPRQQAIDLTQGRGAWAWR